MQCRVIFFYYQFVALKYWIIDLIINSLRNGYPKQVAAQTILRAINNHFKNTEKQLGGANKSKEKSSIEKISFILYDTESVNVYTSELAKLEI